MEAVLPRLPAEVIGVQGDAVAPQAGAGIEGLEAVGLGLGGVDDLPDVDAHTVAENGQLVDQADVDVAVGVFQNLLHLRHRRGGNRGDVPVQNGPVDHGDDLHGVLSNGAHDLGGVAGLIDEVARIDALGGEAQVKVLPALEAAALLQDGLQELFRGAGVGGGLQDDDGAPGQVLGNGDGGVPDIADVGLLVLVQGVGTQMAMKSTSLTKLKSVVALSIPDRTSSSRSAFTTSPM